MRTPNEQMCAAPNGWLPLCSALPARGGKGRSGMATKDEDAVREMFVTSTHNPVLFFSTSGKVYRLKVWKLPEGGPTPRGRPIVNLLPALDDGEANRTVLPLPEDESTWGA